MPLYANSVNTHNLEVRLEGNTVDPNVKGYEYQPDASRAYLAPSPGELTDLC